MQSSKWITTLVLFCKKPYVPTEKEELQKFKEYLYQQNEKLKTDPKNYTRNKKYNGIDASYAGGEDGLEVTIQMFEKIKVMNYDFSPNFEACSLKKWDFLFIINW